MDHVKNRLSHGKELYFILCIVSVVIIFLFSIWGPGGYREMQKMRLELEARRARVESIRRTNSERMKFIEDLKFDKEALERYARQKGYGKKGEIVQQLPQESGKSNLKDKP
jgi:cell division protein FtsB